MLTVKQLRQELRKFPQDLPVCLQYSSLDTLSIRLFLVGRILIEQNVEFVNTIPSNVKLTGDIVVLHNSETSLCAY
jgi:hypothetical protein